MATGFYPGRRLSYDGLLCTVRFHGSLNGTKGEWLGVEWDDPARGKHNGKHQDQQIFICQSDAETAASFIRPTRKPDRERTVLDAIRHKYSSSLSDETGKPLDAVVISGKVAEEVGFDKIAQEQAQLADLRIVLLDQLVVNGIAPRDASPLAVVQAQKELSQTCPNIHEIDLGWNTIERWQDIADICGALPNLKILKAGYIGMEFSQDRS